MDKEIVEMHAIITGNVQGVGFRATARHFAKRLSLTGTVCNLADGNVEIYAQGSRETLNQYIKNLQDHFGERYISDISTEIGEVNSEFDDFNIIF